MSTIINPIMILLDELAEVVEDEVMDPICSECGSINDEETNKCTNQDCPSYEYVDDLDDFGFLLEQEHMASEWN